MAESDDTRTIDQQPAGRDEAPPRTSLVPDRRTIGRYRLSYEIASGGQASVYVGVTDGPGGFEKVVAVKVLHRHGADARQRHGARSLGPSPGDETRRCALIAETRDVTWSEGHGSRRRLDGGDEEQTRHGIAWLGASRRVHLRSSSIPDSERVAPDATLADVPRRARDRSIRAARRRQLWAPDRALDAPPITSSTSGLGGRGALRERRPTQRGRGCGRREPRSRDACGRAAGARVESPRPSRCVERQVWSARPGSASPVLRQRRWRCSVEHPRDVRATTRQRPRCPRPLPT